jgi:protein TonB
MVDFPSALASSFSPDGPPVRVGGSVTPPKVIKSVDARFSEQARAAKVGGTVTLSLVIEKDGTPSHVRVIKGIGYGLDEKAIAAVQQYRFKPAMRDGEPVATQINIQVNFKIF